MGVKDGGHSHNIYIRKQFTPHIGLDPRVMYFEGYFALKMVLTA